MSDSEHWLPDDRISRAWIDLERIFGPIIRDLTESKRKILAVLLEQPGLSIMEVAGTLGVTHTTASRHLGALCKIGLVTREKDGSMERHYAVAVQEPRALSWLRVVVQNPKRYSIIDYLVKNCHALKTVNMIAMDVKVYHGFLVRTLAELEKQELIEIVRPRSWGYVKVKPELVEYWEHVTKGEPVSWSGR